MLRITQSNLSGSFIGQSYFNDATELQLPYYIPTVYEGGAFSVDITFEGAYATGSGQSTTYTYAAATAVSVTTNISVFGLSLTKPSANIARITGPYSNVFPNTYYEFVMPDLSLKVLPPNTTEKFLALERYKMPSPTYIMKDIVFSVTIPPDPVEGGSPTTESVTMHQYVYWVYQTAVSNVQNLVAKGTV
jgi:hypothetical protein